MRDLLGAGALLAMTTAPAVLMAQEPTAHAAPTTDYISLLFVFMLATFIGLGVIARVSRLLHTPLMSLTNAISAIAVVGVDRGGRRVTIRPSSRSSARSRSSRR